MTEVRWLEVPLKSAAMALIAVLALGACAPMKSRSDQEIVAERAEARWKALLKSDFNQAYEYISPAGRSVVTPQGYSSMLKRGFWTDARIREVKCASPELCEVQLDIEYDFGGRRTKTPLREKWVKQDSQWWFLLER